MNMSNGEFYKSLEQCEIAAWRDFYGAGRERTGPTSGAHDEVGPGSVAAMVPSADVLGLNRVIGLGLGGPASDREIDDAVSRYATAGIPRFFVQVCPTAEPHDLPRRLVARGFRHHNNWVKLYRDTSPVVPIETNLELREIDERDAEAFGRIIAESFEWSGELAEWSAALVGRDRWRCFMASDGPVPVGTAAFFDAGEGLAWLDFSTTHPDYRKRGVQAALMIHTMNAAREAGCHTLVIETAENMPGKVAPSYRNALKFGFEVAYVRPNYVYAIGITHHGDSRTMAQPSRRAMSHSGFARTRSEGSVAAT